MNGLSWLVAAVVAFVGTHVVLSHPLRAPLVASLGERGFQAVYSLVAFATFGAILWAYPRAPITTPLWGVGAGGWALATVLMLAASVLLLGSFLRNPALAGTAQAPATAPNRGVFAITRHPMMWAFALWALSHVIVHPIAKNLVLSTGMAVLALLGAALQDRKKAARDPAGWQAWQSRTSYWPMAAILKGRARWGGFGMHALAGGVLVWLVATWAHGPLAGRPAGIWAWLG